MEDYYEYLDSNGVTTLYKLIKDDTVALIDSYSVTINGITTNLDNHINNTDIHTPITDIENMVDTKISGLVNSAPETLDTLKELSDALGNDPNFATTVANQIGNKASKDSVYTKEETNTLLEGKANSVHSHVVSDISDFPTIPTKTSELINDSGFLTSSSGLITSISWSNVTDKPNFSTVATSGSYTDLSNTPTIPTKVSQLENDTGFINALTDVVDTKSNQTINGTKMFSNTIHRYADLTTRGGEQVYRFDDINANGCGHIYNNVHWNDNAVFNRHGAYNAKSGKSMEIDIISNDSGVGMAYVTGTATKGNLETVTSATGHTAIASMGWVNNPETSTNVVHRTGTEYISGTKHFKGTVYTYGMFCRKNESADLTSPPTDGAYTQVFFIDKNNTILGYVEHAQRPTGGNDVGLWVRDVNSNTHGVRVTSDKELLPAVNNTYNLGSSSTKWLSVYATTYYGNLVGSITLNQTSLKMTVKDSNSETTRTHNVILANSSNTDYGINAAFGGASNTVVGAGESCTSQLNDLLGNSSENLYLVADGNIYFKTGANTYANAKVITLNSSAELSGLAKVIATSFVGALTGNVTGNCSGSSSSCTGNSASATKSSYLDNYSLPGMNNIYLDWDKQVAGYVGLKVDKITMGGLITTKNIGSQAANSATYSTTPATTDNSTRIATTAWVRTYVDSVAGSNTVGSSVSAYWSNSSNVTATGQTSASGTYPACYSEYITKTPTVGTIYSGAQLYTKLAPYASATASTTGQGGSIKVTNITAQATFSNPISSTGKYLCTTANTVKFRAYVTAGNSSSLGTASVVDNSSTKSIFIRIE